MSERAPAAVFGVAVDAHGDRVEVLPVTLLGGLLESSDGTETRSFYVLALHARIVNGEPQGLAVGRTTSHVG